MDDVRTKMARKIGVIFLITMIAGVLTNLRLTRADEIPKEGEIIINKEGYKLVEVLSIPWGDGEDQISMGEEGDYKWGPSGFAVDSKGSLYIDDPNTNDVIKYECGGGNLIRLKDFGVLIGVNKNGKIFALKGSDLYVYDEKNILNEKYYLPFRTFPQEINTDRLGKVFLYTNGEYIEVATVEKNSTENHDYKKAKLSESKKGYPSKYINVDYTVSGMLENVEIAFSSKTEKAIKKIKINQGGVLSDYNVIGPLFIGEDNKGDVYCLIKFQVPGNYYPPKEFDVIQKYNKEGEILLTTRIFSNWFGVTMKSYTFAVDEKSNLYQLYTTKSGIKVIRWEQ